MQSLACTWYMGMICSDLCMWADLPQNFLTAVVQSEENERETGRRTGRGRAGGETEKHISAHFELKQFKSLTLLNLLSQAAKVHLIHQEKKSD